MNMGLSRVSAGPLGALIIRFVELVNTNDYSRLSEHRRMSLQLQHTHTNSVALSPRTIPTERPPLVDEI
jgi:hypothetical protein